MAGILEMLDYLPKFIDLILKLALLSIAIFFGRISIAGWRTKLDFITRTIGAVILGFISFAVGILLPFDFVPQIKFVSEMLNSFIVAVVLYVILFLISAQSKPKFLTKRDLQGLREEVDFLKGEVAKINNALISKGIQPKAPTKTDIKRIVAQALERANVKNYTITSVEFENNLWNAEIEAGKKKIVAVVDASGVVKEFKEEGFDFSDIVTRLKKDKFFLAGTILAVIFFFSVISLLTPGNLERISETFSFYGVSMGEPGCLKASSLLKDWNDNSSVVDNYKVSISDVDSAIDKKIGKNMNVAPFLFDHPLFVKDNKIYGAFLATNETVDSLPKFLTVLQKGVISGDGYICSVNVEDNTVCDCEKMNNPILQTQLMATLKVYSQ